MSQIHTPFKHLLTLSLAAACSGLYANEIGPLMNADDGELSVGAGYYYMRSEGLHLTDSDSTDTLKLLEEKAPFIRARYQFVDGWSVSAMLAHEKLNNDPEKRSVSELQTSEDIAYAFSVEGTAFTHDKFSVGPFIEYARYADFDISGPIYANGFTNDIDAEITGLHRLKGGIIAQYNYEKARLYGSLYHYHRRADVNGTYAGTPFETALDDNDHTGFALGLHVPVEKKISVNIETHFREQPGLILSLVYKPWQIQKRHAPEIKVVETVRTVEVEKPLATEFDTSIYYATSETDVTEDQLSKLRAMARFLEDQPDAQLIIEGHCDCDGPATLNYKLSVERAEKVKQLMISYYAIDEERILMEGHGEAIPAASNDSAEGRQKNRRVRLYASK